MPRTSNPTIDAFESLIGSFDLIQMLDTLRILAFTPVSKNAKHGRFDCVLISYPRADKFKIEEDARSAMSHLRAHGVVCGMIGFDSHYSHWLIRRSQWTWAQWLLNNELGTAPVRQPKSNWKTRRRNRR
jgi:hypothetical protein